MKERYYVGASFYDKSAHFCCWASSEGEALRLFSQFFGEKVQGFDLYVEKVDNPSRPKPWADDPITRLWASTPIPGGSYHDGYTY
jgi:hypothetical protein